MSHKEGGPPAAGFKSQGHGATSGHPTGDHDAANHPPQSETYFNTCVTITGILLMILVIAMVIVLLKCFSGSDKSECRHSLLGPYSPYGNGTQTCDYEECRTFVLSLRESLAEYLEPCDDFYEYVCGGWMKKAKVSPDEVLQSIMSETHHKVEDEIGEILNNTVISYRDQTAMQKAAALYQGCINVDLRNSKGTKPLEDLLKHFDIPHWPILNRTAQFRTFYLLGNIIREVGLDAIMSVRVGMDYHNSDRYIVYVGQPSFGVEPMVLHGRFRSPFFRILHRYKLYIYRCALLLGANVAAADVVNRIVGFETRLSAIAEPADTVNNPRRIYNLMSLRTLEGAIPEIRWTYFLNIILKDVGVSLDLDDHIVVMHPLYLKRLSRLLKETPSTAVANYLGWRIVQTMGIHALDRFRRSRFRFDRYRYLLQDITELPRECVRMTMQLMYFAVGRLYFDRHITKPAERYRKVYDLAEEVRDAFAVLIELNTWMDPETKDRARQKWVRSDRDLDDYYKDLPDLRKEEYFVSLLKTKKVHQQIMFSKLRRYKRAQDFGWYPEYSEWGMRYSHLGNYLLLPVEYLQFPFFLMAIAPPINFGVLGSIIGQYMTYGFGQQGALYDDRGKLVEWWTRDSHRKFAASANCLAAQYDQFSNPITGKRLNVNATLETNIADNAGLRLAYKAYKVYMTRYEERYGAYSIPSTEPWNLEQIFFISYAMTRCEVSRKRSMYHYLRPREDIPNRFRTIIPLMNFERFAAAFSCPVGGIMNPEQKCVVW
ncbi:neprilysin-1-like isoform X2 [Ornithodoros turicata]|uniref:neprilysin-1-like isoform X2 n=1 Tax=Ornithodoros turicata TaxID=34597 RepID=UPI0031390500